MTIEIDGRALNYHYADEVEAKRGAAVLTMQKTSRILHEIEAGVTKPPFQFKREVREAITGLHSHITTLVGMNQDLIALFDFTAEPKNNGKPWTETEDHLLVEERAAGTSVQAIARNLERSPSAVVTRLSTLVGVSRSELMERFIDGRLDGEEVRGIFNGAIRKVGA